ncbi:MAG: hypothetical protein AAF676_07430 [Pseudomonadota bacterium]
MRIPLAALLLLAACQTQSLRFSAAEPRIATVEGWRIAVYETEDEVQAIRLNFVSGASRAEMMAFGQRAIRQVTGCRIRARTAAFNPSVMSGRKDCSDPREIAMESQRRHADSAKPSRTDTRNQGPPP